MGTRETDVDIYKVSDNSLYLVRSQHETDTTMKFIKWMNQEAEMVGLKTRFVWIPNGMNFEHIRKV